MARKEEREKELEELRHIGQRIRLARQAKGLTLEKTAEAAETSIQFLSQLEKGEQSMTMVKLGRLATALGVSTDYLIFGRAPADGIAALAADYLSGMNPIERDLLARTMVGFRGVLDAISPET